MNTTTCRLATVRATGRRYIVARLHLPAGGPARVQCWGEVTRAHGCRTTHGATLVFDRADVDIADAEKTPALVHALFLQNVEAVRATGVNVTLSGRKHVTATIRRPVSPAVRALATEIASIIGALP